MCKPMPITMSSLSSMSSILSVDGTIVFTLRARTSRCASKNVAYRGARKRALCCIMFVSFLLATARWSWSGVFFSGESSALTLLTCACTRCALMNTVRRPCMPVCYTRSSLRSCRSQSETLHADLGIFLIYFLFFALLSKHSVAKGSQL